MERPVTVGIFSSLGIPPRYGAFESTAWELSKHLSARGYRVLVQSMPGIQRTASEAIPEGVEVREFPRKDTSLGDVMYDVSAFRALSKEVDAAVVLGYAAAPALRIFKARNVPVILNPDGLEWQRPKFPLHVRAALRVFQGIAIRSASAVIADSPEIKKYHERTYGIKADFAAYGADEHAVTETDRPFRDLAKPGEYFLVVARLEPSVLSEYIVEEYVKSSRREKLLVVGPSTPSYMKRLQAKADDRVVFTGGYYGDRKGLFALRRHCAGYIDGHHTGGINPSTIEAMLAGRHIVAHDNPHIRAALGDTRATLYKLEKGDLARRLSDIPDEWTRGVNQEYVDRARREFSWESICSVYESNISRLVKERRGKDPPARAKAAPALVGPKSA